jgi:pantoate--beta-alanine ligase
MNTITSTLEMQQLATEMRRKGQRIGFVPTMGYLHEGHISLVRKAAAVSDITVVSIFVNPAQFGPEEDLAKYPRDMKRDAELCETEEVDVIFCPAAQDMYSPTASVHLDEAQLSQGLCGASRPGHFAGVLTVVAKLFNIVQPDVAVFGQKDAQQVRLIEKMVEDLDFPVEIVVGCTVREADGLAMSSRNTYLSEDDRARASSIYCALQLSEELVRAGVTDVSDIADKMRACLDAALAVDYVEIVDWKTLAPVAEVDRKVLVAIAGRIGKTRLIDNILIDAPSIKATSGQAEEE